MKFHYLYLVAVLAFLTSAAWAQDEDEISVTNVDTPAAVAISSSDIQYLDCATDVYYSNLVVGDNSSISDNNDHHDWSRHDLQLLLKTTHRTTLAFTNQTLAGVGDVWAALMDMDRGATNDTVRLTYLNDDMTAIPFGIRYWIKEHLFPITKGVGVQGKDFTDIHNLRPSNPLIDFVRRDSFFGACFVLVRPNTCVQPAEGGADDTCACSNNRLFEPPDAFKGQIARALMYMDLRYDGLEPNTLDLRLTDCPFQPERDMAYLSQMITWHFQYPPDAREIYRNQRACERWQGNRNPFIDHPALASTLFPAPKPLPAIGDDRLIYPECELIPTQSPTFTPNECDGFNPGEITFFLINSEDPDTVGLFTFEILPTGFELFLTNNAWDGQEFFDPQLDGQGTVKFTVQNDDGLAGGSVFGYGEGVPFANDWQVHDGNFSLSTDGDKLFLYCEAATGDPHHLMALSYNGPYQVPGRSFYGVGESALPQELRDLGTILLPPNFNNYVYEGPTEADDAVLKAAIVNPDSWTGRNDGRFRLGEAGDAAVSRHGMTPLLWVGLATVLPIISILFC